jgi:hypothetical protein
MSIKRPYEAIREIHDPREAAMEAAPLRVFSEVVHGEQLDVQALTAAGIDSQSAAKLICGTIVIDQYVLDAEGYLVGSGSMPPSQEERYHAILDRTVRKDGPLYEAAKEIICKAFEAALERSARISAETQLRVYAGMHLT